MKLSTTARFCLLLIGAILIAPRLSYANNPDPFHVVEAAQPPAGDSAAQPQTASEIPGRLKGTGDNFEITASEYLNISLQSSSPLHLVLESVPRMVLIRVEAPEPTTSAEITLGGFPPSTEFYMYEDGYRNLVTFTTDENGHYTYIHDLSKPHLVLIQPIKSTWILAPGSGKIPPIGTWDPDQRTFTLNTDVYESIHIDENDLTLDGAADAGYSMTGTGSGIGIFMTSTHGVTVTDVNIRGFSYGVYLGFSSGNTIRESQISAISDNNNGVFLDSSNGNTVSGNTLSANRNIGLYLDSSHENLASQNAVLNNKHGIYLVHAFINEILDNDLADNTSHGIRFFQALQTTVTGNSMTNCGIGIYSKPTFNPDFPEVNFWVSHTIPTDNTVNGKPVYYWKNVNGGTIPPGAGQVILVDSENVVIDGQDPSNGSVGIELGYSWGNTISNNITSNNGQYGIHLYRSSDNNVVGNDASGNGEDGIHTSDSGRLNISNNIVSDNSQDGIFVEFYGAGSTVHGNTASGNGRNGIHLFVVDGSQVTDNAVSENDVGIFINTHDSDILDNQVFNNKFAGIYQSFSDRNTYRGNVVSDSNRGMYIRQSEFITTENNTLTGNGIFLQGGTLAEWNTHTIDTSNTVNGKPVYYWKDRVGGTVPTGAGQVILANCRIVVVENQEISNATVGITLGYSSSSTVSNNITTDNSQYGIFVNRGFSNSFVENTTSNNGWSGIYNLWSHRASLTENTISNNVTYGIYLLGSFQSTASQNQISNHKYGIYQVGESSNILNNEFSNNEWGFHVVYSPVAPWETSSAPGTRVEGNTFLQEDRSIVINQSQRAEVSGNTVSNSNRGIHLMTSRDCMVADNTLVDTGIFLDGGSLDNWNSHIIDTSNTVNGKPVQYLKDCDGDTVPAGAGQVILANCRNVVVENQDVSNGTAGIELGFSSNNTITNNDASNNSHGIYLFSSDNNAVAWNAISDSGFGIFLDRCENNSALRNVMSGASFYLDGNGVDYWSSHTIDTSNTVNGKPVEYLKNCDGGAVATGAGQVILANCTNVVVENQDLSNASVGIELGYSSGNTIRSSTVSDSLYGIRLHASNDNQVYNNNFIDNETQVSSSGTDNLFNLSRPDGGNFWSDWTNPDEDLDGIVDAPYVFTGGQDNLPWTRPDGWSTPPEIECNAPETIVPSDAPISFMATATDNSCLDSVEIMRFDCFFINGAGKRVDKTESCEVELNGDTITILDSGGVGDNITWIVRATDCRGLESTIECQVEVVNPGRGRRQKLIPGEYESFLRGDSNLDGLVNIADPLFSLNYLFAGGPIPRCSDAADANDDGKVDIADTAFALSFLFYDGRALPAPYPEPGFDPTADPLDCAADGRVDKAKSG